jgi:uncharacterized YceG family protein
MAEPTRELRGPRRTRRSTSIRARRIGALVGVLLGVGLLASIGWAVRAVTRSGDEPAPGTTAPETGAPAAGPTLRIVFPEGFTRKEMAERITAVNEIARNERDVETRLGPRAYLKLTRRGAIPAEFREAKPPHLEGFLFPATYSFTRKTTTRELVAMQLDAFRDAWDPVDLRYSARMNLTAYDVLVIASMVEKEVVVPKERPLVAAVIYNRLKAGMPLEIDATIRYGLDIPATEPIRESDLNSDSPYNTRKVLGLTPTPIANPGLASIQAAAHPAEVDYLYFIRKPDCRSHFFTADYDEFLSYPRGGLQCGA